MPAISFDAGTAGKLNRHGLVSAVMRHNLRLQLLRSNDFGNRMECAEHIDPKRSHLNRFWQNERWQQPGGIPDYKRAIADLMKERCEKAGTTPRKIRPDAVLVRSLVYQVTPDFFFPQLEGLPPKKQHKLTFSQRGPLDMEKVESWYQTMLDHCQAKFGDNLLAVQLHLDETGPHIHAETVSISADGRLADSEIWSPKAIREYHTELAKVCSHLGLTRSTPGGAKTVEIDEWRNQQAAEHAQQQKAVEEALAKKTQIYTDLTKLPEDCQLPPAPKKPSAYFGLNQAAVDKWQKEIDARPKERVKLVMRHLNRKIEVINSLKQEVRQVKYQNNQLEKENKQLLSENIQLKEVNNRMKQDFTQANNKLRALPLQDVLKQCFQATLLEKGSTEQWGIGPYIGTDGKTHYQHKIAVSYGKYGQIFIDNHNTSIKGSGAIDLVMKLDRCTLPQATGKLSDYFGHNRVIESLPTETAMQKAIKNVPIPGKPTMPEKAKDPTPIFRLTRERRIKDDTVKHLLETGQLYCDTMQNLILPRPGGGAFVRGTRKPKPGQSAWKRTIGGKSCGTACLKGPYYSPEANPIVVEGITSAMAALDEWPESLIIITGGAIHPDLPPLQPGQQYQLGFDNDQAGQQHLDYYMSKYPEAVEMRPPENFTDWGEYHQEKMAREAREAREEQRLKPQAPRLKMRPY